MPCTYRWLVGWLDVWPGTWVSGCMVEWAGRGQRVAGVHITDYMHECTLILPYSPFRLFPYVIFNGLKKKTIN